MYPFFLLCGALTALYAIAIETGSIECFGGACSRALHSKYSRMVGYLFGLSRENWMNNSNAFYGFCFYSMLFLLWFLDPMYVELINLVLTSVSVMGSLALWYILRYRLNTHCTVCYTTYVVNAILFGYAFVHFFY